VRIWLTAAGRRRFARLSDVAHTVDTQLRSLLSEREVTILEQVLPRIRECWHPAATLDRS
jgi:DNA-binding MarR family transcriptional regulator